jgi:hypothetical protein
MSWPSEVAAWRDRIATDSIVGAFDIDMSRFTDRLRKTVAGA